MWSLQKAVDQVCTGFRSDESGDALFPPSWHSTWPFRDQGQFCFTGGYIEAMVSLPGRDGIVGSSREFPSLKERS